MKSNNLITVFTPTYNREKLLYRLYNSLKKQTLKNFEWLVIDDGSTDNTKETVNNWIQNEKEFAIKYIYKENGGLHTGYNTAIENIKTELCLCIDSDDWMPNDAVKNITQIWNSIDKNKYNGIIGLDYFENGNVVIDKFPNDTNEMYLYEMKHKYKIKGDKKLVFKTEIMKKCFPMPVFKGEKNFNPSFAMYKSDQFGKMFTVNKCFCIVEYQNDGMTGSMLWQYYNSPKSFAEIRKQNMSLPLATFIYILWQNIHYVSSCFLGKKLKYALKESPKKIYTVLAFPLGILFGLYIKYKNEKQKK